MVEQMLSWHTLDLHTPPEAESLAAVQILCVGFSGQPTDRMEQNASSCTHALHKPLTGLRKLEVTSMKVQV